jgi:hypothetical protein
MAGFTARVQTSTINFWIKQVIEPIYRKSVVMGFLKSKGRMKMKSGGTALSWPVRFYRRKIRNILLGATQRSFPNTSTEVHASLPWYGYDMGESIQKIEKLINQNAGPSQIYDLVRRTVEALAGDFTEDLRLRLWGDGTQTGTDLMGILSLIGGSATPNDGIYNGLGSYYLVCDNGVNANLARVGATGYAGTAEGYFSGFPTQTYAGLSTTLGNRVNDWTNGGNTTVCWPAGYFSPSFNFWSPLMVDYNNVGFDPDPAVSTTAHVWKSQWQEAFNAMTSYLGILQKQPVDMVVLNTELLRKAKDSLIGTQRIVVTDTSEARSLGFKSLEYNGCEMIDEYGVPVGMGVGMTWDKLEWHSLQGQLIERTEDTDIVTSENLYLLDSYGQLKCESPANFGFLLPITPQGS